jgi:predicted Zn finger-like uncharacterized protein
MKIVCDACSAKYSISDDKVQGKVFKIRCKKCSNIIVVRGNASAAAPAEPSTQEKDTRVFDYGYDENSGAVESVWHVVIDQDQVGPLTAAEVQKRFSAGEIDADTYIWREGFTDWLPISQVDTFSSLFGGATTTSGGDDSGSLFGSQPESRGGGSAVSDLFGGGGLDTGSSASDDDGDVFAARRPAAAAAPTTPAESKLRGERGENSVLFSLSNLAQLASDGPRPGASSSSASSSSSSAGSAQHGGGEGSGLIDIRSMASAYLAPTSSSAKSASPSLGSAADLPVFSTSGFGEPAVIVPIVRNSASNNNKLIYGLVGLVGVLAVVAVIMVVVLLKDKPAAKPEVVATASGDKVAGDPAGTPGAAGSSPAGAAGVAAGGAAPTTPDSGTPAAGTEPSAGTAAGNPGGQEPPSAPSGSTSAPTAPDKPRDSAKPRDSGKVTKPSGSSSGSKPTSSSKPPEDEKPEKPTKPERGGGGDCDAVACLVDPSQPCCKKSGGGKPSSGSSGSSGSKPDSNLPEQLDSSMIKAGIDKVKGRAQACGSKSSAKGAVKVRIKATPDGKVGSVDVLNAPDDALGNCVAAALKGATFPKTQRGMGFAYTLSF